MSDLKKIDEELIYEALNSALSGILIADKSGAITYCNQAFLNLFEFNKASEVIGKNITHLFPRGAIRDFADIERAIDNTEGSIIEITAKRKDNTEFEVEISIANVFDNNGSVIGRITFFKDITKKKRLEQKIHKQAKEILEMSTPVIQVWSGILIAPIIGTLDSDRTQKIMEHLLDFIVKTSSTVALLDITGVPTVDTMTAQHLIDTVKAIKLLGADVIITGIRPQIAQTIVHLGVDLSEITTQSSLMDGLRIGLEMRGLRVSEK